MSGLSGEVWKSLFEIWVEEVFDEMSNISVVCWTQTDRPSISNSVEVVILEGLAALTQGGVLALVWSQEWQVCVTSSCSPEGSIVSSSSQGHSGGCSSLAIPCCVLWLGWSAQSASMARVHESLRAEGVGPHVTPWHPSVQSSDVSVSNSCMQSGGSRKGFFSHPHCDSVCSSDGSILGHDVSMLAMSIQSPMVGWGLGWSVNVPRPLVYRCTHGATTPTTPVNCGERHVRILVFNLDIFSFVFEVDPCV